VASEHFCGHRPIAEVPNPPIFFTRAIGPKLANHFRSRSHQSKASATLSYSALDELTWTYESPSTRYLLNSTIRLRLLSKLLPLTLLIIATGCAFETADDESDALYPDDELAESEPIGVITQPGTLDNVDFPAFVSDQINRTFQSNVGVSKRQLEEYVKMVSDGGAPPP
jgi:hypothetical protein